MRRIILLLTLLVLCLSFIPTDELDPSQWFSQPDSSLPEWDVDRFFEGKQLFTTDWTTEGGINEFTGLGPHYSQTSCISCHPFNGRGAPPRDGGVPFTSVLKIASGNTTMDGPIPDSVFGLQLSTYSARSFPTEGYVTLDFFEEDLMHLSGDQTMVLRAPQIHFASNENERYQPNFHSLRMAPAVVGLGLIERISEEEILLLEDVLDADGNGISGKANRVVQPKGEDPVIARFGWKASAASLEHQVCFALWNDMGLTNSYFQLPNCDKHIACKVQGTLHPHPEVGDEEVKLITDYVRFLSAPPSVGEAPSGGQKIFSSVGCADCHRPSYTIEVLGDSRTFSPYSDFLLHDMGTSLADGFAEFMADGAEWRTAPLWGLGAAREVNSYLFLMHDGRARNIEEAILWHGGEAEKAKNRYLELSAEERSTLIRFINTL